MASRSPKSLIVVGAGIVGLCLGVAARARGLTVTLIAREAGAETASGVAAGMIAPVLEARSDRHPDALARLTAAQGAWLKLMDAWPQPVQAALRQQQQQAKSRFVASDGEVSTIDSDWLVDAGATLGALEAQFTATGGDRLTGDVTAVTRDSVTLADGRVFHGDHVVLATGFAGHALAGSVPSLEHLKPIKGHLLDLAGQGGAGVVRSVTGYLADYGNTAKFGASMEAGRSDLTVDDAVVAELKARAAAMVPGIKLDHVTPRTGIRAESPDGWPMIGRDATSGVWVATAMRRNGFVFAPLAASVILDELAGKRRRDAEMYDPNRFS